AVPVNLDGSEITVALRQKTIDGIDLTLASLWQYKYYEQIKYVTESNHQLALTPMFINESFYESLPQDLQQILQKSAAAAVQKQPPETNDLTDQVRKQLTDAGIQVSPLDPAFQKQLRQVASPAYDMASQTYGPKFVSDLVAAAAKG